MSFWQTALQYFSGRRCSLADEGDRTTMQFCCSAFGRFWHQAAVRKCPLLRRLCGLSGHRSAIAELSSIYEYTP